MVAGRKRKPASEVKVVVVSTQVDLPTKAALDQISRDEDLSLSHILRKAIFEHLERRRKDRAA